MHVNSPIREFTPDKAPFTFYVMLMSDLHVGTLLTDEDAIRNDLKLAEEYNAGILINGDILDLVIHQDKKRHDPHVTHPDIRGRRDPVNAQVEMATDMLMPYKDLIWMLGDGNHETATEKYHGTSTTPRIVENLNAAGGNVHYGGYEGYYLIRVREHDRRTWTFRIRYHHGAGGAAPVTKGMIDRSRMSAWISDADVLWIGHKHNRLIDHNRRERLTKQGRVWEEDWYWVQTGAYMDIREPAYGAHSQRSSNWASQSAFSPQGKGGVLLQCRAAYAHNGITKSIRAIF